MYCRFIYCWDIVADHIHQLSMVLFLNCLEAVNPINKTGIQVIKQKSIYQIHKHIFFLFEFLIWDHLNFLGKKCHFWIMQIYLTFPELPNLTSWLLIAKSIRLLMNTEVCMYFSFIFNGDFIVGTYMLIKFLTKNLS